MPTNKNAQLRYQILDRCFSDFHHKYFIEDLMDKVNDALMDLYGTQISIRQIREDIKYMKDRVTYNAPIEAYPCEGRKYCRPHMYGISPKHAQARLNTSQYHYT